MSHSTRCTTWVVGRGYAWIELSSCVPASTTSTFSVGCGCLIFVRLRTVLVRLYSQQSKWLCYLLLLIIAHDYYDIYVYFTLICCKFKRLRCWRPHLPRNVFNISILTLNVAILFWYTPLQSVSLLCRDKDLGDKMCHLCFRGQHLWTLVLVLWWIE